jgi:hypothetical protein
MLDECIGESEGEKEEKHTRNQQEQTSKQANNKDEKDEQNRTQRTSLVLSCLVSLQCTLRGLFLAHAAAGLHCTVRSITPPWAGCSGLMHLNHLGGLCGSYTCIARPRLCEI